MLSSRRWAFLVVVFSAIAGAGSLAWAAHGHGGGGGGGHGHGGGFSGGGHGFSGGHGNVSFSHFGGSGFNNHWGGGGRYYSGYRNYGWPYSYYRNNYFRPYAYFGFPYLYGLYGYGGYPSSYYYGYPSDYYSYPSDYYANGDDSYYGDALPPREYVVSRPVSDVAQVQFRLPDPQATIWVQGQEIPSSGTVRQFRSPQLDPAQQYTYTVKAEWRDNGKPVTEERQVKVQANAFALVDFTRPAQAGPGAGRAPVPDLPPPQLRPAD